MAETAIRREPLTGPSVWRGPELAPADWTYSLDDRQRAALRGALGTLKGLSLGQIDRDTVALPELTDCRHRLGRPARERDRLRRDPGARSRWIDARGRRAHLVRPRPQARLPGPPELERSPDRPCSRYRFATSSKTPSVRGYQVRIALPFHTDTSTDLLATALLPDRDRRRRERARAVGDHLQRSAGDAPRPDRHLLRAVQLRLPRGGPSRWRPLLYPGPGQRVRGPFLAAPQLRLRAVLVAFRGVSAADGGAGRTTHHRRHPRLRPRHQSALEARAGRHVAGEQLRGDALPNQLRGPRRRGV